MIRKPRSSDKYGFLNEKQENQMPAFGPDQIISSDLDVLVRYLKDDYAKPRRQRDGSSRRLAAAVARFRRYHAFRTAHRVARPAAESSRRMRAA